MKTSRFGEAKIISVFGRNERGEKMPGPYREIGISDAMGEAMSPATIARPNTAASPPATSNA